MAKIETLWPRLDDIRTSWRPALRGTALGSLIGILPGGAATISSFASYALERRVSRTPDRFGRGAIEGVAGPEAANNAASQTSFIPLLTLGIPSNAVMALMAGALMIQGIVPGPQIITEQPNLFWGLIVSMLIGNVMLVIINLPLVGIWVRLLKVPYRVLFPMIVIFCAIGIYSTNNSAAVIMVLALFAFLGYLFAKLGCECAPFILGFILGPLMEENFRRSMALSRGSLEIFVSRPLCIALLIAITLLLLVVVVPSFRKTRDEAVFED
ncbi:UNVERIFIED_ORG: TctA family transporter [Rhizobium aethiopicum]